MSPRAFIVERKTSKGKSFHVRFKPRGATTPVHWGAYPTRKLALRAVDYVNGELAVGRYPDPHALAMPPKRLTVLEVLDEWIASWPNPGAATVKHHRQARAALEQVGTLHSAPADVVTVTQAQEWINQLAGRYAPATTRKYLEPVRSALDVLDRNPLRDQRIRLPLLDDDDDVNPPPWSAFQLIAAAIGARHRFTLDFVERHGLRMVEVAGLTVGDLDLHGRRIRVSKTKGRTGGRRWLPMPGDWAERLDQHLPPVADRHPDMLVFPGFNARTFSGAMVRACTKAKVGHYTPHQLRHRWVTVMLLAGIDTALVAKMAGHRRQSETLDTYGHILLDEPAERLEELRTGASWVSGLTQPPPLHHESPASTGFSGGVEDTGL